MGSDHNVVMVVTESRFRREFKICLQWQWKEVLGRQDGENLSKLEVQGKFNVIGDLGGVGE